MKNSDTFTVVTFVIRPQRRSTEQMAADLLRRKYEKHQKAIRRTRRENSSKDRAEDQDSARREQTER